MLVDYERVLLELKRVLLTKKSHGADSLLAELARLEVKYQLLEGVPERALRLYGYEVPGDLPRPTDPLSLEEEGHGHSISLVDEVAHRVKEQDYAGQRGS